VSTVLRLRIGLLACLLLCGGLRAQAQLTLKGDPVTTDFPKVSFKAHHRSPEAMDSTDFSLKADDKKTPYTVAPVALPDSNLSKSVLVLWEYLPAKSREAQNKYFRQLLLSALPDLLGEGDEINVATFAWTDQSAGKKTLNPLRSGFSADTSSLADLVRLAKAPGGKGIDDSHGSELYPAISEGIAALDKAKGAKVILVLSAEYPNIYNTAKSVSVVIDEAKEADVAVYNVRYRVMAPKYSLQDLAKGTYGLSYDARKDAPADALDTLLQYMDDATTRAMGRDYQFSFTSDAAKDGQSHQVQLAIGKEKLNIIYNAPKASFGDWFAANTALGIGLLLLLLAAIGGGAFFVWKRMQASKAQEAELAAVKSQSEAAIQNQQRSIQGMRDAEQRKTQVGEAERRRAEAEAEARVLMTEMFSNGRSPRFAVQAGASTTTVALPAPVSTVGRDRSAELHIDHPTLSRAHFQVVYDSGKYMLIDLGSTNGTQLNGQRVTSSELRHGDVVKAGEVTMNFYL
jgi:hypothetical protein